MPDYEKAAERAARRHGLNPRIFKAMIRQESSFNPKAVSGSDAHGIAQFIPSTAKAYGVNLNDNRVSDDLDGAARYLKANLQKYGSYHAALSAYNSGRPDKYKDPNFAGGQTYNYVRKILKGAKTENVSGGSTPSPGSSSGPKSRTVTTSRTIPGEDNSDARRALILQFIQQRNRPGAVAELASGLAQAQDTPSAKAYTSKRVKTKGATASASSVKGGKSPLRELFYNGPGGVNADDGKVVPKGFVSGHTDHVHVAAGPKTIVKLGKLAQRMGLHVGENPHFGGVHPVHTEGSFHYRAGGQAIDVSGDPAKMRAFDRAVARLYGLR